MHRSIAMHARNQLTRWILQEDHHKWIMGQVKNNEATQKYYMQGISEKMMMLKYDMKYDVEIWFLGHFVTHLPHYFLLDPYTYTSYPYYWWTICSLFSGQFSHRTRLRSWRKPLKMPTTRMSMPEKSFPWEQTSLKTEYRSVYTYKYCRMPGMWGLLQTQYPPEQTGQSNA